MSGSLRSIRRQKWSNCITDNVNCVPPPVIFNDPFYESRNSPPGEVDIRFVSHVETNVSGRGQLLMLNGALIYDKFVNSAGVPV